MIIPRNAQLAIGPENENSGQAFFEQLKKANDLEVIVVTVNDTSNYRNGERSPFPAVLFEVTDYPCYWVKSLVTGREYELYEAQIDEFRHDY